MANQYEEYDENEPEVFDEEEYEEEYEEDEQVAEDADYDDEEVTEDDDDQISFMDKYFGSSEEEEGEPTKQSSGDKNLDALINTYSNSTVMQDIVYLKSKNYKDEDIIKALYTQYYGDVAPQQSVAEEGQVYDDKKITALEKQIQALQKEKESERLQQANSMNVVQVLNDAGLEPTDAVLKKLSKTFADLYGNAIPQTAYTPQQLAKIVVATFPEVAGKKMKNVKNSEAQKLNKQAKAPQVLKTVSSQQTSKKEKKVDVSNMSALERTKARDARINELLG